MEIHKSLREIEQDVNREMADSILHVGGFEQRHKAKDSRWHYIPNSQIGPTVSVILDHMANVKKENPVFLELGSGVGFFSGYISTQFSDVYAIERNPKLVHLTKILFPNVRVLCADILENGSLIRKADVLYFYSPFKGTFLSGHYRLIDTPAGKFLRFVVRNMKKGSWLIARFHHESEIGTLNYLKKNKKIAIDAVNEDSMIYSIKRL